MPMKMEILPQKIQKRRSAKRNTLFGTKGRVSVSGTCDCRPANDSQTDGLNRHTEGWREGCRGGGRGIKGDVCQPIKRDICLKVEE
ncbi:hypothetical protein AGOR_G00022580 [Albula goreensis]|uniref:Uncharacterized protein n=1 Tax=Albula goreensis TaxID=1534307 RepID=A0A8T3E0V8_9TELE|nr:hypothetical protein AGOR_G00022580 [Albula goreensis]